LQSEKLGMCESFYTVIKEGVYCFPMSHNNENKVESELQQIEEYLRNNEIARLVVLRAMKLESNIWVRLDRTIYEEMNSNK